MATLNLTARELEMLKAVGRYINTSSVDWTVLAPELGFPNPKRCRDKWYPLRDKLFGAEAAAGKGTPNGSAKKKATPKRKAASEDATPSKKKSKKVVDQYEGDDDEETKTPVKVKHEPEPEPEVEEDDFGELV